MPIISNFPTGGGGGSGIQLAPVSNIMKMASSGKVYVKWNDPPDVVLSDVTIATWSGTILVRKAGSMPSSRKDGNVILDNKERDKYSTEYFTDSGLTDGVEYYYKFFSYTDERVYNDRIENEFTETPNPYPIGAATNISTQRSGDGKLSLTWNDTSRYVYNDGVLVSSWMMSQVVVKEDGYATSINELSAIYQKAFSTHNQHSTSPLIIDNLENDREYYISIFQVSSDWYVNNDESSRVMGTAGYIKISIPTLGSNPTYNGDNQSIQISGYDSNEINAYGDLDGLDAGDYQLYFMPRENYAWNDMSVGEKDEISRNWSINKATGDMSANAGNILFNPSMTSINITLSGDFDGTLTATVSNSSLATTSINGNVVTVTSSGENGSGTIYISASGQNYTRASVDVLFSSEFITIYGAQWDGTSTTAWSRTDASADFVDPNPAVSNGNGSSPFDDIMPWSGMITSTDGLAGVVVAIPKFWFKWTLNGNSLKLQIADGETEGFSVSPAHMDRGDGHGERDVVYIGRYHCVNHDDPQMMFRSVSGALPITNIAQSAARTEISNKGPDIWQWDFAMRQTIQMLYLVEFADWNSQVKIGYGCGDGSIVVNNGQTDGMQYHTGTSASSRITYGYVQYRNIEGLWDNVYNWLDGCSYVGSGYGYISGSFYVWIKPVSSYPDETINIGSISGYTGDYIKSMKLGSGDYNWALIPNVLGGSSSTYIPDSIYLREYHDTLFVGASYKDKNRGFGLFSFDADPSYITSVDVGCRLMKLPE